MLSTYPAGCWLCLSSNASPVRLVCKQSSASHSRIVIDDSGGQRIESTSSVRIGRCTRNLVLIEEKSSSFQWLDWQSRLHKVDSSAKSEWPTKQNRAIWNVCKANQTGLKRCNKLGGAQPLDDTNHLGATSNLSGVLETRVVSSTRAEFVFPRGGISFFVGLPLRSFGKVFRFGIVTCSQSCNFFFFLRSNRVLRLIGKRVCKDLSASPSRTAKKKLNASANRIVILERWRFSESVATGFVEKSRGCSSFFCLVWNVRKGREAINFPFEGWKETNRKKKRGDMSQRVVSYPTTSKSFLWICWLREFEQGKSNRMLHQIESWF